MKITRYEDPKAAGWQGYIEPEDGSAITFIALDGSSVTFLHRDPQTGAVR